MGLFKQLLQWKKIGIFLCKIKSQKTTLSLIKKITITTFSKIIFHKNIF